VGNEKFILPKQDSDNGASTGATEIPVSWKLGIDITCENAGDTAKVIHGGPTCTFQGKQIPCISCCGSIKFF